MRELIRQLLFLPSDASTMASDIDSLHFFVISVTFVGAAAIGMTALWFLLRYRRQRDDETTKRITMSGPREVGLAIALLSLFMLWWTLGYRQYVDQHRIPEDAVDVYVTGKQWMWKFAYENGRQTAGMLVVPKGEDVVLRLTSRDVVHSFFVPAFRIKLDAVPGRYNTTWFRATSKGAYRVFCAEYCGQSHSRMWAQVVVLEPQAFQRWLGGEVPKAVADARHDARAVGEQAPEGTEAATSLVAQGREAAAEYGCLSCHTLDGQPHVGPTWQGLYDKQVELESGRTVEADTDYLTESMMNPKAKVVAGYEPVMPSFAGVLPQKEVAPIVELIKSLEDERERAGVELPPVEPKTDAGSRPDAGAPDGGGAR